MTDLSFFRCLRCGGSRWTASHTLWRCDQCDYVYPCVHGVPQLLLDERLSGKDRWLRDYFYDGLVGRFYQFVMPFLTLPARPFKTSLRDWAIYAGVLGVLVADAVLAVRFFVEGRWSAPDAVDVAALVAALLSTAFFVRHRYLFSLLMLAIPVKVSLSMHPYRPKQSFPQVHGEWIDRLKARGQKLRVLDISTGTCNSLFRHGWMKLGADYVGLDLSKTMLLRGLDFMASERVSMQFVIGDAQALPFVDESFDVVLNYGALNGYGDAKQALSEMARVARPDGLVLFLDEQLYDRATLFERAYFAAVLSSHNVIHKCPVELLPQELEDVTVHQIYQFYYLCTCVKRARGSAVAS